MSHEPREYFIEAGDDKHEWDSDYVGNGLLNSTEVLEGLAYLKERAKTDPVDPNDCTDGISWAGWVFRIITDDDDGCYCVEVDENEIRAVIIESEATP